MYGDTLGDRGRHDSSNLFDTGQSQLRDAAEATQQLLRGTRANAGNIFQASLHGALRPALAMECHSKPVSFVADLLN